MLPGRRQEGVTPTGEGTRDLFAVLAPGPGVLTHRPHCTAFCQALPTGWASRPGAVLSLLGPLALRVHSVPASFPLVCLRPHGDRNTVGSRKHLLSE